MDKEVKKLEEEAYAYLAQDKFEEAYRLFIKVAGIYKSSGNHKQAALCFASAASCWNIKLGEKTFYNAASSYEEAARQAERSGDLEYASMLYKYAAINYERDMEFFNFSECFYLSKESLRKFLTLALLNPKKIHHITKSSQEKGFKGYLKRIFLWFTLTFSYLVWGHGERPLRTFSFGIAIILIAAYSYTFGYVIKAGSLIKLNFAEAFYFSNVTFTTVGYGDIIPVGFNRIMAIIEALSGIFIMPLFIISLSRKYLRV
jgi:tetratricopeptide (TPR) repeat protein